MQYLKIIPNGTYKYATIGEMAYLWADNITHIQTIATEENLAEYGYKPIITQDPPQYDSELGWLKIEFVESADSFSKEFVFTPFTDEELKMRNEEWQQ